MNGFDHNPEMEAAIEAKVQAAHARGVDLSGISSNDPEGSMAIMKLIGITPEEDDYMAKRQLVEMAKIELGRRIVAALDQHCRVEHAEIIPCLTAYFEAKAEA